MASENKLYQIYNSDLIELEQLIPELTELMAIHLTTRSRTQLRRIKEILSNVRWNYGPHTDGEIIPAT